jgi:hypothetical protein
MAEDDNDNNYNGCIDETGHLLWSKEMNNNARFGLLYQTINKIVDQQSELQQQVKDLRASVDALAGVISGLSEATEATTSQVSAVSLSSLPASDFIDRDNASLRRDANNQIVQLLTNDTLAEWFGGIQAMIDHLCWLVVRETRGKW